MRTVTKGKYSTVEIRDIAISVLVLSVAFALMFSNRGGFAEIEVLGLLCISAVIVCASFVSHELAHKFAAQRFGAWAEYRMFPAGLMLALMMSLFGVIFAAPGVVYIEGHINRRENGVISAAGPGVNIILGFSALCLALITSGILSSFFWIMASINAFFAVFNMIPIRPFDGSKIIKWNIFVYIAMLGAAIALLGIVLFL